MALYYQFNIFTRQTDSYVVIAGDNVRLGFCQISKVLLQGFSQAGAVL